MTAFFIVLAVFAAFASLQLVLNLSSKKCLPEHIRTGRHTDYIPGFRWIPRSWTSFCWPIPHKIAGSQKAKFYRGRKDGEFAIEALAPIPPPGKWQLAWPLYFAFTTKGRLSFRIGARWDDIDWYHSYPTFRVWRIEA